MTLGAGANLNINGGTFATNGTLNLNGGSINVASGAALQAGLSPTQSLSTSAAIAFQSGGGLKVVTDGTSVSKLLNANISKGISDIFRIIIAPTELGEFNLTSKTLLQGNLSGFTNGTFNQIRQAPIEVVGDGFTITNWSLTVQNGNEIQLDSLTVTPVPEPGTVLLIGAAGLAAAGAVRRRFGSSSLRLLLDLHDLGLRGPGLHRFDRLLRVGLGLVSFARRSNDLSVGRLQPPAVFFLFVLVNFELRLLIGAAFCTDSMPFFASALAL